METTDATFENRNSDTFVILFTDIVGSTGLQDSTPSDEYLRLLNVHDEVFRETFGEESMNRKIIKHTGDGFLAVIRSKKEAVDFALKFQHALKAKNVDLTACIGMHWGTVHLRENGDISGLNVSRASRVLSIASDGQILMTQDVVEDAKRDLALDGATHQWVCHRSRGFKGIALESIIWQVGLNEGGAPFTPPPETAKSYIPEGDKVELLRIQLAEKRRNFKYAIAGCIALPLFFAAIAISIKLAAEREAEDSRWEKEVSIEKAQQAQVQIAGVTSQLDGATAQAMETQKAKDGALALLRSERALAAGVVELFTGEIVDSLVETGRDTLRMRLNGGLIEWFGKQQLAELSLKSLDTYRSLIQQQINLCDETGNSADMVPVFEKAEAMIREILRRKPKADEAKFAEISSICRSHALLLSGIGKLRESLNAEKLALYVDYHNALASDATIWDWNMVALTSVSLSKRLKQSGMKETPVELSEIFSECAKRSNVLKIKPPEKGEEVEYDTDYTSYDYTPSYYNSGYASHYDGPSDTYYYDYGSSYTDDSHDNRIEQARSELAKAPDTVRNQIALTEALIARSEGRRDSGKPELMAKAIEDAEENLRICDSLVAKAQNHIGHRRRCAKARLLLGSCYFQTKKYADALGALGRAVEEFRSMPKTDRLLNESSTIIEAVVMDANRVVVANPKPNSAFQYQPETNEQWTAACCVWLALTHRAMGEAGNPKIMKKLEEEARALWPAPPEKETPSPAYTNFDKALSSVNRVKVKNP